jgi:phosphoadenosine phosphosulfate reductase
MRLRAGAPRWPGPEDLRRLAERARHELAGAPAEEVVRWAVTTFGRRVCVTSSMSDAVLIHIASRAAPGIDVLFVDTGYHFAETIGTRDSIEAAYPVNVINVTPPRTVAEQDVDLGPRLHDRDPDLCCQLRKVEPLSRALAGYDCWITGIRREETAHRRAAGLVDWDGQRQMVKVNPLVDWTQRQVAAYVEAHGVPVNPLLDEGYASVGCAPCTRPVAQGADPRSGRWPGRGKSECGIHL